ncbi:putative clathrin assembly protein [Drosera capensis]
MSGGGTNTTLRKALGSIKDTTTINLAKVSSDYKELDIAIVKATNHVERPAKEKHMRAIFAAVSAVRPRADVAYCIHALARRLSRTHNWAVALKTLIVIHRGLREVDPTFHEELINYQRSRGHMLNLAHFKDDSSALAWDYSSWVRAYALYLEERLECFRVLKYDFETERPRTKDLDTVDLLEQLPALQQLMYRVLGCQPEGAATHNYIIQVALSLVATESMKIYTAISDGIINLVDKFFEMQRHYATKALDIYRRAGLQVCMITVVVVVVSWWFSIFAMWIRNTFSFQADRLSEFYEVCKNLDVCRGQRFLKIEQPIASFLQAMEDYAREAPRGSTFRKEQVKQVIEAATKEILAIEDKKVEVAEVEVEEKRPPAPPHPEPVKDEKPVSEPNDLLGLNDPNPVALDLDEKNALALAIVPVADPSATTPALDLQNGATGWELALVTAPSSNESATATSKLAGGLDLLILDSMYDDAIRRSNQTTSYNPWEPAPLTNPMMHQAAHDPFYASNTIAPSHAVQMAAMANQQQAFLIAQQPMMGTQQVSNPFGNPYGANPYGAGMPAQAYNSYTGLI